MVIGRADAISSRVGLDHLNVPMAGTLTPSESPLSLRADQQAALADDGATSAETTATVAVPTGFVARIGQYLTAQRSQIHVRLLLVNSLLGLIPAGAFGNVRCTLYRLAGFRNIADKVYIFGTLELRGPTGIYSRLHIGEHARINAPCFIELSESVRIGQHVSLGHHLVVATTDHEVGTESERCGPVSSKPVTIGDGSWLGARVTVLPGVTIGAGAIVAAGSVVMSDVPSGAKVAGNPARVIGWLNRPAPATGE